MASDEHGLCKPHTVWKQCQRSVGTLSLVLRKPRYAQGMAGVGAQEGSSVAGETLQPSWGP